jgi:hypothetical protein
VRRTVFGLGAATILLAATVRIGTGCDDEGVTAYGNPNTLDRKNLPGEAGAEPLTCGSGGDGGGQFDGGCPSFATDIFPYFTATGKWQCSTPACHGGASIPAIRSDNAAAALQDLRAVTVLGRPYLGGDGGVSDPQTSTAFICNLQGSCGSKMPKAPGIDATREELCLIDAWLRCGSPP